MLAAHPRPYHWAVIFFFASAGASLAYMQRSVMPHRSHERSRPGLVPSRVRARVKLAANGGVPLLVEKRTGAGSYRRILRGGGDSLIHHHLLLES
jgi:hypothetical protein